MFLISTFYHLADLDNYEDMQSDLLRFCVENSIKGTIILSPEGINSTVCGTSLSIRALFDFLSLDERLKSILAKDTYSSFCPFQKMKVVLKKEIVNMGIVGIYAKNSGNYIECKDWDKFISRTDVKLIDVRNFYETDLGRFVGSIVSNTKNFRDFPSWFKNWVQDNKIHKNQNIAMYCTGGIRCEKSTAFLIDVGFNNVYHLRGGIISYLMEGNGCKNKWFGDCFVFDDRVALTSNLETSTNIKCKICGCDLTTDDLKNVTKGSAFCSKCSGSVFDHSVAFTPSNAFDKKPII